MEEKLSEQGQNQKEIKTQVSQDQRRLKPKVEQSNLTTSSQNYIPLAQLSLNRRIYTENDINQLEAIPNKQKLNSRQNFLGMTPPTQRCDQKARQIKAMQTFQIKGGIKKEKLNNQDHNKKEEKQSIFNNRIILVVVTVLLFFLANLPLIIKFLEEKK